MSGETSKPLRASHACIQGLVLSSIYSPAPSHAPAKTAIACAMLEICSAWIPTACRHVKLCVKLYVMSAMRQSKANVSQDNQELVLTILSTMLPCIGEILCCRPSLECSWADLADA